MSGPVALHGGGEFEPGDEAVLTDLLRTASGSVPRDRPVRISVVPTAAADFDPARSGDHGAAAFERVAASMHVLIQAETVLAIDPTTANDGEVATRLRNADLIYLPGGDPRRIISTLRGTAALSAILAANAAGTLLAGASAGAMALAAWSFAPNGGIEGFGLVPGILVVPHADARRWSREIERLAVHGPEDLGFMGLAERTAAITRDVTSDPIRWRIVGEGQARWLARRASEAVIAGGGGTIETWTSARA